MKNQRTITILTIIIAILSAFATLTGILSGNMQDTHAHSGIHSAGTQDNQTHNPVHPGDRQDTYTHTSIRGQDVEIHGRGIYRHMSADVAIQGIAQDYVTLFAGIPLLVAGLLLSRRRNRRGRFLLAGTSMYFFVTYLFYLTMGMYNALFLVYAALLSCSFFHLLLVLLSFNQDELPGIFDRNTPVKFAGSFLLANVLAISLLWLSVVVPPLLDGTIYPPSLQHYTTLIVQGLDLGLLLPAGFVAAILLLRRHPMGLLAGTTYLGFLSLLMAALLAKLTGMALTGVSVIPAIFIIPVLWILATTSFIRVLGHVRR